MDNSNKDHNINSTQYQELVLKTLQMLADEVLHHVKNEVIKSESTSLHSSWVSNLGKKIGRI